MVAANVADQALVGPVIGEGDGAVRALTDVAAGGALERAGKAAAVEEEDGLLAFFQPLFEGGAELVGEDGGAALVLGLLDAHVHHADERHGRPVGAFVEAEEGVFVGQGVVPRLQGRRGRA